jgi:hypothetical protein
VLAAGGGGASESACELYNPTTNAWAEAVLLNTGNVLVVGGNTAGGSPLSDTELYSPSTGAWSLTGKLMTGRTEFTATLLTTGQVLAAGGLHDTTTLSSAEVYQP